MKISKIALKLASYFVSALLLFALTIGTVFFFLFRDYTIDVQRDELVHYAEALADAFSDQEDASHHEQMMSSSDDYLKFIEEVAGNDVWLVDRDFNPLATSTMSRNRGNASMNSHSNPLPIEIVRILPDVFQGETIIDEGFSEQLQQKTLTIGVPITNNQGQIWASALLQSPINGLNTGVQKGLGIFAISLLIALLLALIFAFFLSYSFTKPLSKMKKTALQLAHGDYTAQTKLTQQDEIGELSETIDTLAIRLDEASQESQKLEQLRQDYVANISHELRTPVTVLRGSLEALTEEIVTDPQKIKEYHQQMFIEATFLERLVGDLLDLSRLQNLDFQIEKAPVSLQEIIADTLRSARQLGQEKELTFETQLETAPLLFLGDYGRLRQMLLIVLDNAIKFSPVNGTLRIEFTQNRLTISDQGEGIAAEDLPYIFDRFHKTYGENNKVGTGLGLAIARQIAERHQILLTAENRPTGGAQFIFDFSNLTTIDVTTLDTF